MMFYAIFNLSDPMICFHWDDMHHQIKKKCDNLLINNLFSKSVPFYIQEDRFFRDINFLFDETLAQSSPSKIPS